MNVLNSNHVVLRLSICLEPEEKKSCGLGMRTFSKLVVVRIYISCEDRIITSVDKLQAWNLLLLGTLIRYRLDHGYITQSGLHRIVSLVLDVSWCRQKISRWTIILWYMDLRLNKELGADEAKCRNLI